MLPAENRCTKFLDGAYRHPHGQEDHPPSRMMGIVGRFNQEMKKAEPGIAGFRLKYRLKDA